MEKNLPIIVIGAGGHAKVVIDTLLSLSKEIIGMTDPSAELNNRYIFNVPVIGTEDVICKYATDEIQLVIGFGSVRSTSPRKKTYLYYKKLGYSFADVIHPSVIIASEVQLGEGIQLMAGSIIQPCCKIGNNTIINTGATIDHDCYIGDHVHIAPGVTLSGSVIIGEGTHIGTGTKVIEKINIGRDCLIAAGSLVITNIDDCVTVMGVPAKIKE